MLFNNNNNKHGTPPHPCQDPFFLEEGLNSARPRPRVQLDSGPAELARRDDSDSVLSSFVSLLVQQFLESAARARLGLHRILDLVFRDPIVVKLECVLAAGNKFNGYSFIHPLLVFHPSKLDIPPTACLSLQKRLAQQQQQQQETQVSGTHTHVDNGGDLPASPKPSFCLSTPLFPRVIQVALSTRLRL